MSEPRVSTATGMTFTAADLPARYDALLGPTVFGPWARVLLDFAGVREGQRVLDVASGTGIVSRAAAKRVGPTGGVTASDISPAMLGHARSRGRDEGAAPIEFVECSAQSLAVADASHDVVLCQQGLEFFPDRAGAIAEMRRALRPGGTVAVAVWATGRPFGFFGTIMHTLAASLPEPFPGAFALDTYRMPPRAIEELFVGAGLRDVVVEERELVVDFGSIDAAVDGIGGTPFSPALAARPAEEQARIRDALTRAFTVEGHRLATWSVLARGTRG